MRSSILPATKGPLSLTVTTIELPLLLSVTLTLEPHGSVLCAAAIALRENFAPQAVGQPSGTSPTFPYQEQIPSWTLEKKIQFLNFWKFEKKLFL